MRDPEKELLSPDFLHIPIGLKYLKEIELNCVFLYSSFRSCSHSNLVFAYIDFGEGLNDSETGCLSCSPYTAAEDEKIRVSNPFFFIADIKLLVPSTLLSA